jgi:DNA-binding LacI/PurR family transcriptional regulator
MDTKQPKHRLISIALREQIAQGRYADGKRLPSEAELARRFGVSRPTAGRALRELLEMKLIERRVGSGSYLRQNNTETVAERKGVFGLLVPGLGNTEILDPICGELTNFAQSVNCEVLWGDGSAPVASAEDAEQLCKHYINRKVSGVFFAPLESITDRQAVNRRIVSQLRAAGIAVILLDRDVDEFPQRSEFDLIGIDNFSAGFILTRHLIDLGHRRFAFLARPSFPSTTDLRLAGCREAASRANVGSVEFYVEEPENPDLFIHLLQSKPPDCIICANDRTAALLIQNLLARGIKVPTDVCVVGFDDVRYATLLSVPLTTIRQPCREIGQVAVRVMKERIANPSFPARQILLPVELVVRQSCGAHTLTLSSENNPQSRG